MIGVRRSAFLGILAGAMLLAVPAAAACAADLYVSPGGTGNTCSSASPCNIYTAPVPATDGDTIFLEPGAYELVTAKNPGNNGDLPLTQSMTLKPALPGTRPLLKSTDGSRVYLSGGAVLEDLDVDVSGQGSGEQAVRIAGGGTLRRVNIVARGNGGIGLWQDGTTVDTTVWAPSDSATAVGGAGGTMRNVTAIASGASSYGVRTVLPFSHVTVQNSIVRGTTADLRVSGGTNAGDVFIAVKSSNYVTTSDADGAGTVSQILDQTGNLNTSPIFRDAAAGDFHQLFGSPTINSGDGTLVTSATDIDGQTRQVGANVDMGADEFPAAVAAPVLTGFSPASPAESLSPSVLGTADPGTHLDIYTDQLCAGPIASSGSWQGLSSPGIGLTVPGGSTTTFYAKADLGAGMESPCSAGATYQVLVPQPPIPGPNPPVGGPTGQRAAALKKCKKKHGKKRKKCKKRAKKLPV